MNMKIIPIMVGAVVIIAVFGAILPVFGEINETTGTPITKTNNGTGHTFKEMEKGDVLKCESVYSGSSRTDTWTLNGETVLNEGITGLTWDWGLISDVYFLQINSSSNPALGSGQVITSNPSSPVYYGGANETYPEYTYTWTMENDGTISFSIMVGDTPGTGATFTPTWAYVVSTIEKGAYMSAQVTTNPYFAKEGDKNIILAGNYTTGDLDTGYYYGKDGVLTVVNENYSGTVNFTQERSSGTTDIYDTLVTVSITDGDNTESFSPYRALVPYQVSGHADSGVVYTMFGLLPLLIAVGLVVGIAGVVIYRRM